MTATKLLPHANQIINLRDYFGIQRHEPSPGTAAPLVAHVAHDHKIINDGNRRPAVDVPLAERTARGMFFTQENIMHGPQKRSETTGTTSSPPVTLRKTGARTHTLAFHDKDGIYHEIAVQHAQFARIRSLDTLADKLLAARRLGDRTDERVLAAAHELPEHIFHALARHGLFDPFDMRESPLTLAQLVEKYFAAMVSPRWPSRRHHLQASSLLIEFCGPDVLADSIGWAKAEQVREFVLGYDHSDSSDRGLSRAWLNVRERFWNERQLTRMPSRIAHIFRWGVRHGHIDTNPFAAPVKRSKRATQSAGEAAPDPGHIEEPSKEEMDKQGDVERAVGMVPEPLSTDSTPMIDTLLDHCEPTVWRALIALVGVGGLSLEEAQALHWRHVRWDLDSIELSRSPLPRRVPLFPSLRHALIDHFNAGDPEEVFVLAQMRLATDEDLSATLAHIVECSGLSVPSRDIDAKAFLAGLNDECIRELCSRYPSGAVTLDDGTRSWMWRDRVGTCRDLAEPWPKYVPSAYNQYRQQHGHFPHQDIEPDTDCVDDDPVLSRLNERWPELPQHIRATIGVLFDAWECNRFDADVTNDDE